MAKIVDLMKSIICIFNDHAGQDKMLDKEELKTMMGQGKLIKIFPSYIYF